MANMNFVNDMRDLGFHRDMEGTFNMRNRAVAYDNDCSDDERDDSFYEDRCDVFSSWARPIIAKVRELAKKHSVSIEYDTSAEYGTIDVEVK